MIIINYLKNNYNEHDLNEKLVRNRKEYIKKGYTSVGPHRTDILFYYQGDKVEKHLSRGQIKLFAAALVSAQLEKLKEKGGMPIMLVDDLSAELDHKSSEKMFNLLLANKTQTFITSTEAPNKIKQQNNDILSLIHI